MLILGIDPGKSGGFVALDSTGHVVHMKHDISSASCTKSVLAHLQMENMRIFAYVEKAQAMPKNGAVSMFNYGQGFGEILGVLSALAIPFELVPPSAWTKAMLSGVPASATGKQRAALAASRLFPGVDLRASERCKVPHYGLVDSLLIAEYGRRKKCGELK